MPVSRDRILYEDDDFLGVNKLSGELVVKGKGKVEKLPLLDFLKKSHPGLHPLQRLDFETSGIVVFAKNRVILQQVLESKFAGWKKTYRTIVMGRIPRDHGDIRLPLPARSRDEKVSAISRYHVLRRFGDCTFVEVEIETGRQHQIRRHLSMIGHALILDDEYGNAKANKFFSKLLKYRRFFLHAFSLSFPHPVSKKVITIEAPLPRNFEEVLKKLQ
jgi:RluA family pseudouridine synthase